MHGRTSGGFTDLIPNHISYVIIKILSCNVQMIYLKSLVNIMNSLN